MFTEFITDSVYPWSIKSTSHTVCLNNGRFYSENRKQFRLDMTTQKALLEHNIISILVPADHRQAVTRLDATACIHKKTTRNRVRVHVNSDAVARKISV